MKVIVYLLFFSHHQIVVVVFPDFATATATTNSSSFTDEDKSSADAYTIVNSNKMPAEYVAIQLLDSEWTEPNRQFTIGSGDTSKNAPLQTGFYYKVFIRAFSSNGGSSLLRNVEQQSSSGNFSEVFVNPVPPSPAPCKCCCIYTHDCFYIL